MWEFIKKHKIPLIILGVSVGLYLLYDYLRAASGASANSAAGDTNAADQAALQDELASLENTLQELAVYARRLVVICGSAQGNTSTTALRRPSANGS